MKKLLAIALIAITAVLPAHAQMMTIDMPVFAGTLAQLEKAGEFIKQMSEVIGAAKQQIDTLQQVSSGIRNLKKVMSGGVQGLMGAVSDELGLKAVFTVGKELQATYTSGQQLIRDARDLPDEAKRQLKDIGLAVDDVEQYLNTGLMYEAFQGMGMTEWKQVFKDPKKALSEGAVGRACSMSEAYLDTTEQRKLYAQRLQGLSEQDKARLSGNFGVDMALLDFADWGQAMDKRIVKSLNYSTVADKLMDAIGTKQTITEQQAAGNATTAAGVKLQAETYQDQSKADSVNNGLLAGQTHVMTAEQKRNNDKETIDAIANRLGGKY